MNPYDADAALAAIRPRLEAARSRRRRSVGASAAIAMLAMSSVAYAAVIAPSDPTPTMVVTDDGEATDEPAETSLPDSRSDDPDGEGAGEEIEPAPTPPEEPELDAPSTEPPAPAAAAPAPEPEKSDPPPAPPKDTTPSTEAPKPSTTTTAAPAQSQTLTFTYPGTGSVTVTQTGNTLALVSATAEAGWTHKVSHQSPDLIGVEFTRDNVQRWLKVKVVNGVAKAEQHEQVKCVPPPGTATYQAPNGAGSMTVQVDQAGKLSLVSADPAAGWNHQILHDKPDMVKVGFWGDGGNVWVLVKVHDCALKVETG